MYIYFMSDLLHSKLYLENNTLMIHKGHSFSPVCNNRVYA